MKTEFEKKLQTLASLPNVPNEDFLKLVNNERAKRTKGNKGRYVALPFADLRMSFFGNDVYVYWRIGTPESEITYDEWAPMKKRQERLIFGGTCKADNNAFTFINETDATIFAVTLNMALANIKNFTTAEGDR